MLAHCFQVLLFLMKNHLLVFLGFPSFSYIFKIFSLSLAFSTFPMISSSSSDGFILSFPICMLLLTAPMLLKWLLLPVVWVRIVSDHCLLHNLKGKSFSLSPFSIMLDVISFSRWYLSKQEGALSFQLFLTFSHEKTLDFVRLIVCINWCYHVIIIY